uniref:Uncharacterized protein n=1 Tax=Cryptophlebia leucotreta granulosis virus TaxID=35254 RepID=A0A2H4ZKH5_GVCL|nr:hypothetical protein [Cryptophlebia leucotreta granulovirus]
MIYTQTTHFDYKKIFNLSPTNVVHCIRIYKNVFDGTYFLLRGEQDCVNKTQKDNLIKEYDILHSVDIVHCVWNYLCDTKHQIELIGVKIFSEICLETLINVESNRVINFGEHYFEMFVGE